MKPSDFLTETQKRNFYDPVEVVWEDGRTRTLCRGQLLLMDKFCPSLKMIGLVDDDGELPRLQVNGSTRDYEQLHLRRTLVIFMQMEKGLPCMKDFSIEMSKGYYDFQPKHLEYNDEGAHSVDLDETYEELLQRMMALKFEVCPDTHIEHMLMGLIERKARIFAEKLSTPKKEHCILKSPPAPSSSPTGGAS